jgi:hypothetical protein
MPCSSKPCNHPTPLTFVHCYFSLLALTIILCLLFYIIHGLTLFMATLIQLLLFHSFLSLLCFYPFKAPYSYTMIDDKNPFVNIFSIESSWFSNGIMWMSKISSGFFNGEWSIKPCYTIEYFTCQLLRIIESQIQMIFFSSCNTY